MASNPAQQAAVAVSSISRSPDAGSEPGDTLMRMLRNHRLKEMVFAVVGYAGSGTSFVAGKLRSHIETNLSDYQVHRISARQVLDDFATTQEVAEPEDASRIEKTRWYQSIGDQMRQTKPGHCAVAAHMIRIINQCRNNNSDGKNIYILDSLKHPLEVDLLRHVYGHAFCLIGVGCRPDIRTARLMRKFDIHDISDPELIQFIDRDAEDSEWKYGQQVDDTFHRSDYFVDNTMNSETPEDFKLPDEIKRLCEIVLTGTIHRPRSDERGMYHAAAASMRSSCLSRQVGASILDQDNNLIAVGANEVPKPHGGSYDENSENDDRCFKTREVCSNTQTQNEIVEDIFARIQQDNLLTEEATPVALSKALKSTRIKALIEFSRSVHAEMDALLSLVRTGTRLPHGSVLYSTTYPCHNCARHIVAAGIARVVYLEPYSKSMAIDLHDDSIADNKSANESKGKVVFLPYQGVSPRLYKSVYMKTTDLKDKKTGKILDQTEDYRESRAIWTKTSKDFEQEIIDYITNEEQTSEAGEDHAK